jgi:hypothetical protein
VPRNLPLTILACALAVTYAIHLCGPLRIVDDAPLYLAGAVDLANGRGYHDDHMPRGYSQALATLDLVGLGSAAGIVALNLASMLAGLVCVSTVLRRELELSPRETMLVCLLSCSSWMWIYLAAVPMSDMLFFFLSSATLAMLSLATSRVGVQAAVCLAAAAWLAASAFAVRTIGAALFVPVAFALLSRADHRLLPTRRFVAAAVVVVALAAAVTGIIFRDSLATPWYSRAFALSAGGLWDTAAWRVGEIGEIVRNVPTDVAPESRAALPVESTSPLVLLAMELRSTRYLIGAACVALIGLGLLARARWSSLEAYLAAYVAILLIWPFEAVRFWAPVLPFLLALLWTGLKSTNLSSRLLSRAAVIYSLFFIACGAVAMGNSLDTTLADRGKPWRENGLWLQHHPTWLAAYDRFGGNRPQTGAGTPSANQLDGPQTDPAPHAVPAGQKATVTP